LRLYHDSSIIKTAIKAERTYLEYVDAFNPIVAALTMLAVCLACSPSAGGLKQNQQGIGQPGRSRPAGRAKLEQYQREGRVTGRSSTIPNQGFTREQGGR